MLVSTHVCSRLLLAATVACFEEVVEAPSFLVGAVSLSERLAPSRRGPRRRLSPSLPARPREELLGTTGAVTEKACWSIDGASRSLTTTSLLALLHACSPLRSVPGPRRRRKAPWRTVSLSVRLPRPPPPRKVLLDVGALVLCGLVLLCLRHQWPLSCAHRERSGAGGAISCAPFKRCFGSRVAAAGPSSCVGSSASGTLTRHAVTMIVECPKASSLHLGLRPLGDEISPLRSSVCKATLHETVEQSRVTRCDAPRLGEPCQGLPAPGTVVGLLTRTQMHFALKLQTSLSRVGLSYERDCWPRSLCRPPSCPFLRARLLAAFSLSAALLSRSFRTACQLPIAHMTVQLRNECTCSSSFSSCRSTSSEAFSSTKSFHSAAASKPWSPACIVPVAKHHVTAVSELLAPRALPPPHVGALAPVPRSGLPSFFWQLSCLVMFLLVHANM